MQAQQLQLGSEPTAVLLQRCQVVVGMKKIGWSLMTMCADPASRCALRRLVVLAVHAYVSRRDRNQVVGCAG
jgi:hypothetical protein